LRVGQQTLTATDPNHVETQIISAGTARIVAAQQEMKRAIVLSITGVYKLS